MSRTRCCRVFSDADRAFGGRAAIVVHAMRPATSMSHRSHGCVECGRMRTACDVCVPCHAMHLTVAPHVHDVCMCAHVVVHVRIADPAWHGMTCSQ